MAWIVNKLKDWGKTLIEAQATIWTGGLYLAYKYGKQVYDQRKELSKLMSDLKKSSYSSSSSVETTIAEAPLLKGTANSIATNKTQPYHIGKNLYTPLVLNGGSAKSSNGVHEITPGSSKVYWDCVYECGFSKQILSKVYMGDLVLKDLSSDTSPQDSTYPITNSMFGNNSYIEFRQLTKSFTNDNFRYKTIESEKNDFLKTNNDSDYEDLYYTLEKNTYKAKVIFCQNGLRMYNSEGQQSVLKRDFWFYYSLDYAQILASGGDVSTAHWDRFYLDQGTYVFKEASYEYIQADTLSQIYFSATATFDYTQIKDLSSPITIRIKSAVPYTKEQAKKNTYIDDCYIRYVQSSIFDVVESKKNNAIVKELNIDDKTLSQSAILGLHIESTTANQDLTDYLQIETKGVARIFYQSGALSNDRTFTQNPASWVLEILTSDKHPASQLSLDDIDLTSFKSWYDFCEQKNLKVNMVITNGSSKNSILDKIFNVGRAYPYLDIITNKYCVVYDDIKSSNNSPFLNEQNCVKFSYQKDMGRMPDGLIVKFIDSENDYHDSSFILMYDRYKDGVDLWTYPQYRDSDCTLSTLELNGITNHSQAFKQALFTMKCGNLRKKTATAEVGLEGLCYKPLQKVLVQHPTLKVGLGSSEIKTLIYENSQIIGATLYQKITMESGKTYNAIIQHIENNTISEISVGLQTVDGLVDEVRFKNSVNISKGDILSFGYGVETITNEMVITGIAPNQNTVTLTLVDYDARVYDESEDIPEYKPTFTTPNSTKSIELKQVDDTIGKVNSIVKTQIAALDLKDWNFAESPNIYSTVKSGAFSVDDDGKTPIAQKISTEIKVIQDNYLLDFRFGDVVGLPSGCSITYEYHTATLHINSGVRIVPTSVQIPIYVKKYLHAFEYGDENENVYIDQDGDSYGYFEFADEETLYTVELSWSGIKGGSKLGLFKTVAEIPTNVIIGDFFTWGGDNTGSYKKGGVYAWDGAKWIVDNSDLHNNVSFSDVLSIANDDLAQNNSTVYQYLNHLTANSIFVNKLVSNRAFIDNLLTHNVTVKDNLDDVRYSGDVTGGLKSENFQKITADFYTRAIAQVIKGWQLGSYVSLVFDPPEFKGFFDVSNISAEDIHTNEIESVFFKSIFRTYNGEYWEDSYNTVLTPGGLRSTNNSPFTSDTLWSLLLDDNNQNVLLSVDKGSFYVKDKSLYQNNVYVKTRGRGIIDYEYWADSHGTYGWELYDNKKLKIFGVVEMSAYTNISFATYCPKYTFNTVPFISLTSLSISFGELFATSLSKTGFMLNAKSPAGDGAYAQWSAEGLVP